MNESLRIKNSAFPKGSAEHTDSAIPTESDAAAIILSPDSFTTKAPDISNSGWYQAEYTIGTAGFCLSSLTEKDREKERQKASTFARTPILTIGRPSRVGVTRRALDSSVSMRLSSK